MPKKRIYYNSERELEGLKWTAKVIDFGVGLSVIAALNDVYSAAAKLRDNKKLYRMEIKRFCNMAVKQAGIRECEIKKNMSHKAFWSDYSDKVIDEAETDITLFRIAIKQELDKCNIQNSDIISHVECARTLLEMSIVQFDAMIESAQHKCGRNYRNDFAEFRVSDVFASRSRMCDILYQGYSIDLNTENVIAMFDGMSKKFAEGEYIHACMEEAIRNNPDFIESQINVIE